MLASNSIRFNVITQYFQCPIAQSVSGGVIELDEAAAAEPQTITRSCLSCNSNTATIEKPRKQPSPHIAEIRCQSCDRFIGWLGRSDAARYGWTGGQG